MKKVYISSLNKHVFAEVFELPNGKIGVSLGKGRFDRSWTRFTHYSSPNTSKKDAIVNAIWQYEREELRNTRETSELDGWDGVIK